jgi:hypothetical protein
MGGGTTFRTVPLRTPPHARPEETLYAPALAGQAPGGESESGGKTMVITPPPSGALPAVAPKLSAAEAVNDM